MNSGISRRNFIGKTGAAATGIAIVAPEAVRGSQANSKISVGLIGAGNRGSYDASMFHADPRARVTALCDLFDDRIETAIQKIKITGKPDVYKDFEKLLASNVDAVLIATPPFEHPRMLEAAIQARKHVYCEKPMGVDLAGVKTVIAAGRKRRPEEVHLGRLPAALRPGVSGGLQAHPGRARSASSANARAFWIADDPFTRRPYPDPKIEKLRNWFCYQGLLRRLHRRAGLPQLRRAALVPGRAAHPRRRHGRHQGAHLDGDHGPPDALLRVPRRHSRELRGQPVDARGLSSKIGEEFTGTKGVIATSRQRMMHIKGPRTIARRIESKRDITIDGIEGFLTRVQTGNVENVAERSGHQHAVRDPRPDGDLPKARSDLERRFRRDIIALMSKIAF